MWKLDYKISYLSIQFNWLSRLKYKTTELSAFAASWIFSQIHKNYITSLCLFDPSRDTLLSFWVFPWWFWMCMNITRCMFLSPWSTTGSRVHQWARPSLDRCFRICEMSGTEWNIRRIKNWINMVWRTQRIAKCSILVWRRELLALAFCICMCY
jgi:hypothetical protein